MDHVTWMVVRQPGDKCSSPTRIGLHHTNVKPVKKLNKTVNEDAIQLHNTRQTSGKK